MAFDFNFAFGKRKVATMDENERQERLAELRKEREEVKQLLLQDVARLEGRMGASTKVNQSDVYDLLCIVRGILERR